VYSTCLSCGSPLGANQALESFPVGRRLAFDPSRGRLWVLCGGCRGWNLAPLLERWEALEEAEHLFSTGAIGAHSRNVALGRLPGGTELVRIGGARLPELAAWRYGRRLTHRWRRYRSRALVGWSGGAAGGLVPAVGGWLRQILCHWQSATGTRAARPVFRSGTDPTVRAHDAAQALLLPGPPPHGWRVRFPRRRSDPLELSGADALRALRAILPRINRTGAHPSLVRAAASRVQRLGSPGAVLRDTASRLEDMRYMTHRHGWTGARPHRIATAEPSLQLALEMAANEETERAALDGELRLLEREWREAEELAAISDDLLLPGRLVERIRSWGRGKAAATR